MRQKAARVNNVLAWIVFLGTNVLIFLIALSVFGAAPASVHAMGGIIVWLVAWLLVITAVIARASKLNVGLSILVLLLIFPVQGIFAHGEFPSRVINALHAANGLTIMWLSFWLAVGSAKAKFAVPEEEMVVATAAGD